MDRVEPSLQILKRTYGYFGAVEAISKHTGAFYSDNSHSKVLKQTICQQRKAHRLEAKLTANSTRIETWKLQNDDLLRQNRRVNELLQEIDQKYQEEAYMERAAVKIQKVMRGYLARKSIDELVVDCLKKGMESWLKFLDKNNFRFNFHVGLMPDISARKIQRSIKRYLFRRKIERLQFVYEIKMNERMYIAFALIRRVVYTYGATSIVNWKKFKIYRIKRLDELKYSLAALQVKKHWKKMRLSIKLMRQKIKKYKRRLKNAENAKALEAAKAAAEAEAAAREEDPNAPPAEGEAEAEEEEEVELVDSEEERLLLEQQRIRAYKIQMGKVAYSIPKEKEEQEEILPYLFQKDNEESLPCRHHKVLTNAIASRMGASRPVRYTENLKSVTNLEPLFDDEGQPLFIKPKPVPRPKKQQPPRLLLGQPLYMKETLVSKLNKKNPPVRVVEEEEDIPVKKPRLNSTLMNPTQSYLEKKSQTRSRTTSQRPAWKHAQHMRRKYLPSIDNSFYKPDTAFGGSRVSTTRPSRLRPLTVGVERPTTNAPIPPEPEFQHSPAFSLDFTSAFPEFTDILSKYSNSLQIHVKPRLEKMKGFAKPQTILKVKPL